MSDKRSDKLSGKKRVLAGIIVGFILIVICVVAYFTTTPKSALPPAMVADMQAAEFQIS